MSAFGPPDKQEMVTVPLQALVQLIEIMDDSHPEGAKHLTGELRASLPKKHPGYVPWYEIESDKDYIARKDSLMEARNAARYAAATSK
jgi:hypothetical protein